MTPIPTICHFCKKEIKKIDTFPFLLYFPLLKKISNPFSFCYSLKTSPLPLNKGGELDLKKANFTT